MPRVSITFIACLVLGSALAALPALAAEFDPNLKDANPLKGTESLEQFVTNVVQHGFFPVLGMAALLSVLWGAFQWITSAGSAERVKLGRDTFLWVVLGLALAFGGYALLRFVIQVFLGLKDVN